MTAIQPTHLWLDGANTTILHHGDGAGTAASVRVATTAGPFTFTASSVTDTNGAPWNVSTAVAGDMIVTVDGFVGRFNGQGSTTAIANVDKWINVKTGVIGTPAGAASAARIIASNTPNVTGPKKTLLRKLNIKRPVNAGTITLYAADLAFETWTMEAGGVPATIWLDIPLNGPVGIATSGATVLATLTYEHI